MRRAILASVLMASAACGEPGRLSGDYASSIDLTPRIPLTGQVTTAVVTLGVGDNNQPWSGAKLQLEAHMNHPGMAPIVAPVADEGQGVYRARLTFTMAGDWTLFLVGELPDGRRMRDRLVGTTAVSP